MNVGLRATGDSQVPTQSIEGSRLTFAMRGSFSLSTGSLYKIADYQANQEQHHEGEDILGVVDSEGQQWGDKEEVKRNYAQERYQN